MSASESVILPSARKHGLTDDDIRHIYANPIRVFELDDGFVMLIGGDTTGALCEIGVVYEETGPVIVHAMAARDTYLD